jgi:integrase
MMQSVGVPCLRRHEKTDEYYVVKKVKGKLIGPIKLVTKDGRGVRDRKLAERLLREWIDALTTPPSKGETLQHVIDLRRKDEISKLSESRKRNFDWIINILQTQVPKFINQKIADIKASMIEDVLGKIKPSKGDKFEASSFNEIPMELNNVFDLAVRRSLITENPFTRISKQTKRRKIKAKPTPTPSFDQFYKIVESIRFNKFTDHAEESADFVEFMGCAGLGAAEVRGIRWRDIKRGNSQPKIDIQRRKTGVYFKIPVYPRLKPVLEKLQKNSRQNPDDFLFQIKTVPKKALASACRKLRYPNFTPRSLRKMQISELLQGGTHYKCIAKWQGHQDGGLLILKTYSNIISESEDSFESAQISKLYDQQTQSKNEW